MERPFWLDLELNFTWLVERVVYWTTMALLVLSFDRLLSRTQNRIAISRKAKIKASPEAVALLGAIALAIWLAFDMIY
jgi:hypothetical protein